MVPLPRRVEALDCPQLLGDESTIYSEKMVAISAGSRHTALLTRSGRLIIMYVSKNHAATNLGNSLYDGGAIGGS